MRLGRNHTYDDRPGFEEELSSLVESVWTRVQFDVEMFSRKNNSLKTKHYR